MEVSNKRSAEDETQKSPKRLKFQMLSIPLQECSPEQVEMMLVQNDVSTKAAKLLKGPYTLHAGLEGRNMQQASQCTGTFRSFYQCLKNSRCVVVVVVN